jgi:hypothetical protein
MIPTIPHFTNQNSNLQRERQKSNMKTPWKFAALCRLIIPALLAFVLGQHSLFAQANANPPGQISYQGSLVDNKGFPLATNAPKNYNIIFRIYGTSTGDTNSPLWAEQQVVTVDRGYFSVLLGQGSAVGSQPNTNNLTGLFTGATASDRYIGLVVQGLAVGGDVEITPRLRLLASPYALLAANANAIVSGSGASLLSTFGGFVGINKGGVNPSSVLDVNGTVTATNFVGSGAGLFGLNAANITIGTLPDARLSVNVPLNNGNATFNNLTVNGTLNSPKFAVSQAIPYGGYSFPRTGSFVSHGGTLMFIVSASCFVNVIGYRGVNVYMDGIFKVGVLTMYFNQVNYHLCLPGATMIVTGIGAGTHTVSINASDSNVLTDGGDNNQVTVVEFPF